MTHQATTPAVAHGYFTRHPLGPIDEHPIITRVYRPERGWVLTGYRKRVSGAWVRKLRAEGVASVELTAGGRRADFTIAELLRR